MTAIESYCSEERIFPKEWALGAIVDRLPPLPYEPEDGLEKKGRPLGCWYRLNYHMNHQPYKDILKARLGKEQKLSCQLLHEWWTAQYQDAAFSAAARWRELAHAKIDLDAGPTTVEAADIRRYLARYLHLEQPSAAGPLAPLDADHGQYHKTFLELFEFELGFDSCYDPLDETSEMIDGRRGLRREGAIHAYCQAVGWKLYQRYQQNPTGGWDPKAKASRPEEVSANRWNYLKEPSNAFLSRGPVLNPCPWLKEDYDELGNMPYYLWDLQRGCTVATAELDFQPQYVAISHTWGRWVKCHPILVEGVPWEIPQNARFRVEDIADILSHVPGGLDFVWFDLVCIPQDGSDIGAREIARQAKIFRGAKYAIAWLNTIDNLDGLFSGMAWKALQFLTFSTASDKER